MNTAKFCPQCGSALLPGSPVCPRCAFQVAMGRGGTDPTISSSGNNLGRFVPPKPEQLAQHFPQLEILDLIGQGGMGAVYKARQRGLDRIVALKILPPDAGRDPAFEERFRREGKALARLSHPNIVTVYDSNEAGGLFYFIMEYVDGINLRQAIAKGTLTPKEALGIVPQICDALQYAHDEGIVHRDIKPENVLVDSKGRVKIADFGLARLLGKGSDSFMLTATHQVMGTPRYMAPEQLEGTRDVDHRADIYSLGVVFYEMLTGELPLGRFAPPSKKVQVDVRLDEVVLRTLEKEPDLRYQQASEIKTAVQTISGPDLSAIHQRMYGREYRSKLEFFGLPLVHVASGIDPKTQKPRIAKGIIAIGDQAYGGLAIGGFACGLIAIGGVAMGGITLGGLSIGLGLAIGGGAIGCTVAMGGCAVAPIAVGGCAMGYYAAGGAGFGIHTYAANARDVQGAEFFSNSGRILMQLMPFLGLLALVFPLGALFIAAVKAIIGFFGMFRAESSAKSTEDRKQGLAGAAIGCFLLLILALTVFVPVGILLPAYFFVARQERSVAEPVHDTKGAEVRPGVNTLDFNSRHQNLDWTDDGPSLSSRLRDQLMRSGTAGAELNPELTKEIDQVLKDVHRQYREVEAKLVSRSGTKLHQTTTIQVPADEVERLQQLLWTQLDKLLNAEQQATMRNMLPVVPKPREELVAGDVLDEAVMPGILGWGKHQAQVELSKGGDWYEWQIASQGLSMKGYGRGLDPRWKRLWKEGESNE